MKVCRKCKREKPMSEFYVERASTDGRQAYCKVCAKEASKAWESANIDKVRAANPEKAKAKLKAWRAANPDKVAAANERLRNKRAADKAAWLAANKDAITKPIKIPGEW